MTIVKKKLLWSQVVGSIILGLCCLQFGLAQAAVSSVVAADVNSGYSAKVVKKVVQCWRPPPLVGAFDVQLLLNINAKGQVEKCTVAQSSGLEVFDQVALSAVNAAQPFGSTPQEAELNVFLVLHHDGKPESRAQKEPLSDIAAMNALTRAKNRMDQLLAVEAADAVEERARLRAEYAAKSAGLEMPQIAAVPSVETPVRMTDPKPQQPKVVATQKSEPKQAPKASATTYSHYVNKLSYLLGNKVILNMAKPTGNTLVTLKLAVLGTGRIQDAQIIHGTGNQWLDRVIRRKVLNLGTIQAPPEELLGKQFFIIVQPKFEQKASPSMQAKNKTSPHLKVPSGGNPKTGEKMAKVANQAPRHPSRPAKSGEHLAKDANRAAAKN